MRSIIFLCLFLSFLPPLQADDLDVYIGAGGGLAHADFDVEGSGIDADDSDVALQAFAGFRYTFFGLEAGYTDLGNYDIKAVGITTDLDIHSFFSNLVAYIPLTDEPQGVFLLAKIGGHYWEVEADAPGFNNEEDGTDLTFGAGFGYHHEYFNLTAEWKRFVLEDNTNQDLDIDIFMLNLWLLF